MNLYRLENLEYNNECFVVAENKEIAHELSIFKDIEYVSIVALARNITIQEQAKDEESTIVLSREAFIKEYENPTRPPNQAMKELIEEVELKGWLK